MLQHSEDRFRVFFEKTADAMLLLDSKLNKFVDCNRAAMEMLRFKDMKAQLPVHPAVLSPEQQPDGRDSFEKAQEMIAIALRKGSNRFEWTHLSPYREEFPVEVLLTPLVVGKECLIMATWRDITRRKHAEEKLKLAADVFTYSHEGILITDATGTILDVNDAFADMTGYSRHEIIGKNPRMLQSGRHTSSFYSEMWKDLNDKGYWKSEIWNRRKSGEVFAEIETVNAVRDSNGVTGHYVAISSDITQLKDHQKELERLAHFDSLTSLPNRSLLADRLSQAMLHCQRQGSLIGVLFMDLDGFKEINDKHGHGVGDDLLIAVSKRMKDALREGDTLARIGGDEFLAVLDDLDKPEACVPILERLLLAASSPVAIKHQSVRVSASIGVTFYPTDNVSADQLMRHADQAMYAAKENGKDRYHVFDIAHDDAIKTRRESLIAIRGGLDDEQFVLYYQPKVDMKNGRVLGVEALIRWQHPELGLLLPSEFLPVLDDSEMNVEMGDWVLDTAMSQISNWRTMDIQLPSVSVNISSAQIEQSDFVGKLQFMFENHAGVDPSCLELEILESNALHDLEHVSSTMEKCIALGINFALDDFGTGYSSLTYLRTLPARAIKIDQSFVRDMLSDPNDLAIVESIIALSKSFKRDVIAEGVESIEHGTALLKLGCDLAQGYGIAKPMPASEIPLWLAKWKPHKNWVS